MSKFGALALCVAAALLGAPALPSFRHGVTLVHESAGPALDGHLSVMTYNIKGLPWPIASGRDEAISAIGQRLASMRSRNVQPQIVLLQEAFGEDANALGKAAGYRFVVTGPQASGPGRAVPLGGAFADRAQWIRGERSGSLIDSGLAILSDYPVIRIARRAFPEGACAGYDCLAAKGVLVAWIDVPGAGEPIAVVDTHLNSRHATHVASARADRAYTWQAGAVRSLLSRVIPSGTPVILGGDFNIGRAPARLAAVSQPLLNGHPTDALESMLAQGGVMPGFLDEARHIAGRNKDKIFFRDGARIALRPQRAWVPFRLSLPNALSDHAGFVIAYSLELFPVSTNGTDLRL